MSRYEGEERRQAPRFAVTASVTVGTRSEQQVRGGEAVNVSAVGILVSFPGPALPVNAGDRCLVSLQLPDRVLHLIGQVTRRELGTDGRYYVGVEYDRLPDADVARLRDLARHEGADHSGG